MITPPLTLSFSLSASDPAYIRQKGGRVLVVVDIIKSSAINRYLNLLKEWGKMNVKFYILMGSSKRWYKH